MATYLAFTAHRDDEINIAGTLIRLLEQGHSCVVACMTNGSRGGLPQLPEDERKGVARSEFNAACAVIGCETRWLDINEHDLPRPEVQQAAREQVFRILCEVDPDCLILHPGPPLPQFDYHEHHWIASHLPYVESYSASNPNYARPRGLEPMSRIPVVYYMCPVGTPVVPNRYVDISAQLEGKLEAAACYESQVAFLREHDRIDFVELHRAQSIALGSHCGCNAAEAFCACPAWNRVPAEDSLPC